MFGLLCVMFPGHLFRMQLLWFRSTMSPHNVMCSELEILEGDLIMGVLYLSTDSSIDELITKGVGELI